MAGTQREGPSDEARLEEQPDAGALRAPDSAPESRPHSHPARGRVRGLLSLLSGLC